MTKLMLIDHQQDTLQFMKEACTSIDPDIDCISFVYAQEAVKTLLTGFMKRPSAVLINLNVSGKNGVHCLMELRSSLSLVNLPIVLYAPKITREVVEALKRSGVTAVFEKPNTIAGWKKMMREILNSIENVETNGEPIYVDLKAPILYVA